MVAVKEVCDMERSLVTKWDTFGDKKEWNIKIVFDLNSL